MDCSYTGSALHNALDNVLLEARLNQVKSQGCWQLALTGITIHIRTLYMKLLSIVSSSIATKKNYNETLIKLMIIRRNWDRVGMSDE